MLKFTDEDLAGRQANAFNKTSQTGAEITVKLGEVINSLKSHWIGSDASTHINSLIQIREALYDIAEQSIKISYATVEAIREIQEIRSANGGKATTIQSAEVTSMSTTTREISKLDEGISEMDVRPEARQDHTDLVETKDKFRNFVDSYNADYDALMGTWLEGGGHEQLVKIHQTLNENAADFIQIMQKGCDNLNIAIENYERLHAKYGE